MLSAYLYLDSLLSEADDIGNKDSIWSPRLFDLTPTGFRPLEYGSLYVFEVDGVTLPQDGWGHAGSPILDRDGFVVALVSAIVRDSGKLLILATPIQPRTPGATNVLSLDTGFSSERRGHSKCSLSSTVRKIRNQVEEHATWNVKLERDLEGVPKDELTFSYESMDRSKNTAVNVSWCR